MFNINLYHLSYRASGYLSLLTHTLSPGSDEGDLTQCGSCVRYSTARGATLWLISKTLLSRQIA